MLEGATVTVYRNDEITLDELIALKTTQLVISPGPGHPTQDAGISKEAIAHFSGKIPVFGVCMGQYAMTLSNTPELSILIILQAMHLRSLRWQCGCHRRNSSRQNLEA